MSWDKKAFDYDGWVARLKKSGNKKLQEHFFLGSSYWTGEPILFSDKILGEHIWVTGGSGSGKSARILAPLVSQVIDRRDRSVIFIDQKDDPASFWNCYSCAYRAGMPFKYFSMVPDDESFAYHPLRQEIHRRLTPMLRAESFIQAAGMDHGEIYGSAFFQGNSELTLCNYFTHFADPPIDDYLALFKLFNDKFSYANIGPLEDWVNAGQLRPILARAASISSLNATPKNVNKPAVHANAMEMFELLRRPCVYYFKLPASMGRTTGRFIARNVLQNLFASAGFRSASERVPVMLICDEFQELVGPTIDVFLEQCRSRDITCVLAHQSIAQLERNGVQLLPIVQACVSTHYVVEATDFDSVEYVQKRSGQAYFALTSWSQAAPTGDPDECFNSESYRPWKAITADGSGTPLLNVRQEIGYRMDQNFIRRASAASTMAFIAIKKNSGFSNFDGFMIPMRAYFHIDKKLFDDRSIEPWPKWDRPETVIVKMSSPFESVTRPGKTAGPESIQIVPPPQSVEAAIQERLRRIGQDPRQKPGQS